MGGREEDPKRVHDNERRKQKKHQRENKEKEKLPWRRQRFLFLFHISYEKTNKKRAAGAKKISQMRRRRGENLLFLGSSAPLGHWSRLS